MSSRGFLRPGSRKDILLPSRSLLWTCASFLVPSFCHSGSTSASLLPTSHSAAGSLLSPTAYLDGLRGFAALFVFFFHFFTAYFPALEYGFLHTAADTSPFQLPVVRAFMAGTSLVSIFFVISGYALSYKTIKLIRRRDVDVDSNRSAVLSTLSSSTFRRAIRLNVPVLISLFGIALLVQAGAFDWAARHATSETIPGFREADPPILPGFWRQMVDVFCAWLKLSDPFTWEIRYTDYDAHLWTIPLEFRASLLVFLSLLGLARVKSWIRMAVLSGIAAVNLLYYDRWDVCCFLSGTVLAELTAIRAERKVHGNNVVLLPVLIFGLYLASIPDVYHDAGRTPGYQTISAYSPSFVREKVRFWPSVSAIVIVCVISFSSPNGGRGSLQDPFTTPFAQYLGRISFAMYLMHGFLCRTLGFWCVVRLWEHTGRGLAGYFVGVMGGWTVVAVVLIWVSDIFWRAADVGSVRLARWLEAVCLDIAGD